jgi:hypothetical protein
MSPRKKRRDWSQLPHLITALTAVGALVFTGLSLQATREQLDIAQTAQITERFTSAVEHLSDATMDIRLGAVLALERIARDSETDREAVGELLAAFVRRTRPVDGPCRQDLGPDQADVEAALRVVATAELVAVPDLSATCLSGADLSAARLRCATLVGTYLQGTTKLVGADLRQADLTGALLNGTDPDSQDPMAANLTGADLAGAQLSSADLSHTYLVDADLRGADLSDTTLTGARLRGADLSGAYLARANLDGADLSGATLTGTHIRDSTFGSPRARADALDRGAVNDAPRFTARPCGP